MINLSTEQLVSLSQAANNLSTDNSTVWRWMMRGCKSRAGILVKLDACKVGGKWITSLEAIQKFSAALTEANAPAETPKTRTPKHRQRSSGKAARKLATAGREEARAS